MAKWTPGPWTLQYLPQHRYRITTKEKAISIADIAIWKVDYEENTANARLITAAPEMFEALQESLSEVEKFCSPWIVERVRTALAKASGGDNECP